MLAPALKRLKRPVDVLSGLRTKEAFTTPQKPDGRFLQAQEHRTGLDCGGLFAKVLASERNEILICIHILRANIPDKARVELGCQCPGCAKQILGGRLGEAQQQVTVLDFAAPPACLLDLNAC
ncbi:MAG: hypothetical protein EBW73_13080 [Betaproteobacteria bacterium]|nr:hypothetical protein [Betaproteobacteria bacterium]